MEVCKFGGRTFAIITRTHSNRLRTIYIFSGFVSVEAAKVAPKKDYKNGTVDF